MKLFILNFVIIWVQTDEQDPLLRKHEYICLFFGLKVMFLITRLSHPEEWSVALNDIIQESLIKDFDHRPMHQGNTFLSK